VHGRRGTHRDEVAQQLEPVARRLLGVKLDAGDVLPLDDRREPLAVFGGSDDVLGTGRAASECTW
jgi:hypothetical protein